MIFKFKKEPSFSELWDICVHNFLYNPNRYINEILSLFKKNKINKNSKILDVSAGTGFPAIGLIQKGYDVECMDAMSDEIRVFSRKARKLRIKCKKLTWLQIPKYYSKTYYDFVFCRGNSFIYAAGGWNKDSDIKKEDSLKKYKETLKIFYNLLNKGGILYLDKFLDREKSYKTKFGVIKIKDKKYDLFFYIKILRKFNIREARILMRDEKGRERGLPNITYLLRGKELTQMLKKVGFKKIKKIQLKSENNFDVWLAYK